MKIFVDALFLRPGVNGGGETYIRSLLSGLSRLDRKNTYLILVNQESQDTFRSLSANFETRVIKLKTGKIAHRLAYEQTVMPIVARHWGADVAFFPANMMSFGFAALAIPSVVTIHDAAPSFYREVLPGYDGSAALSTREILLKWAARAATQIVADTEFGRLEIVRTTGVCEDEVKVVYLGSPGPLCAPAEPDEVFRRLGIVKPYVLTVGRVQKHKNFDRLVRAFTKAKRDSNLPHQLVIAGRPENGQADLEAAVDASGTRNDVRVTGFIRGEDLAALYGEADVFALPSLYEGFGLPVIEAMKAGIPVLCSTAGSLPEVCGDAALLCDPLDEESISAGLCKLISDQGLTTELVRKGRLQAEKFTWERTAAGMLDIFRSVSRGSEEALPSPACAEPGAKNQREEM